MIQRRFSAAGWAAALLFTANAGAAPPDPWAALERVRGSLASRGARVAEFEHVYVPAGFTAGEKESGRLAISLPDCLRWDYREPYAKTFLVCGNLAHAWNPEDKTGQRQTIDRKKEPGLDLLLLPSAELKTRYQASAEVVAGGQLRIRLTPIQELHEVRDAAITVDAEAGVISGLEYTDLDGNQTRFTLTSYGPLTATDLFTPPSNIEWQTGSEP